MARQRSTRHRMAAGAVLAAISILVTACGGGGGSTTKQASTDAAATLKFSQWWAAELPKGMMDSIVSDFEKQNPKIKIELVTNPYQNTHDATIAQAATKNTADIIAMDGTWYSDLQDQGALANMSELMKAASYDDSTLSGELKTDGSVYMIPAVNFIYPMFVNLDLLKQAGVTSAPKTRSEFRAAAKAVTDKTDAAGVTFALSPQTPGDVANDVMAWVWASGGSMLTDDGKPDINNKGVADGLTFLSDLYKDGSVLSGSLNALETQKPNSFAQGKVAMMFDSLAHVSSIKETNPNLNFDIAPAPVADGYSGKQGINSAAWAMGISNNTKYKAQAWKFVQYLMSPEVNAQLASGANGFAGNKAAKQDFSSSDALVQKAATIYADSDPINQFASGLPASVQLQSDFLKQLQQLFTEKQDVNTTLKNTQAAWEKTIAAATK